MSHDERTLRDVAELHASCIDQGFLSSLGPRFLTVLYRAIDRSDSAVLIVETDITGVIGFVSGGRGMGPIYKAMLRDWPALIRALAPAILSPRKARGILDIMLRGGGGDAEADRLPACELFSIAVAPSARGKGTSDRLYAALCAWFRDQGATAFRITVGDTLAPAHCFYTRQGAIAAATVRVHGGATSTIYVHDLDQDVRPLG